MNKPKVSPYGSKFYFLLVSIYIMQCLNYAAVSTNKLSQHFRVANPIENASRKWDSVFIGLA